LAIVLDTDPVDPVERSEYMHWAMGVAMVSVEWHWVEDGPGATAHGLVTPLGDLTVCVGETTANRVERTPALARDGVEPTVFVNLQLAGTAMVVQEDREAVLHPGAMAMYDSSAPYTLLNEQGMGGEFFQIPHSALALPTELIREACAVPLIPQHPLATLTFDYLRRLASDPSLFTAVNGDLAGQPSIELLRAVITTQLGYPERAAEPLANTLLLRVLDHASRHLGDPELSAESIAAAHFISVRHLYKVLAEAGISLSQWIRSRRLEAARHELAHTRDSVTISSIARRQGFSDMSSFSRAFRAEYGLTPRDWRAYCLRAGATPL
jgi:AraC-like DNA-binding protein